MVDQGAFGGVAGVVMKTIEPSGFLFEGLLGHVARLPLGHSRIGSWTVEGALARDSSDHTKVIGEGDHVGVVVWAFGEIVSALVSDKKRHDKGSILRRQSSINGNHLKRAIRVLEVHARSPVV